MEVKSGNGRELQRLVVKQLELEEWADKKHEVAEAFVMCPAILAHGQEANGWWIRAAIEEFLHPTTVKFVRGNAFVAGPSMETEVFLSQATRGDGSVNNFHLREFASRGWEPVEPVLTMEQWVRQEHKGPWAFQYSTGRWHHDQGP